MAIDHDELDRIAWDCGITRADFPDLGTVFVPGEGENPLAIIIGEAPGGTEEIRKRPFVGRSGVVLRQLMVTSGLWTGSAPDMAREGNCWLTNVVKFRPPGNRTPMWDEVRAFRPLVRREWIGVGKPRIIIPVGGTALKAVSGRQSASILKHAGWVHMVDSKVDGDPLWIWPQLHPAFGLRNKSFQVQMEKDWEAMGEWIRKFTGGRSCNA